ncbi:hypothetical protein AX761_20610 [Rhizobium sp. 58]|nr:hypothetical protein AX761_20610 [Rhizobium sp. 58]
MPVSSGAVSSGHGSPLSSHVESSRSAVSWGAIIAGAVAAAAITLLLTLLGSGLGLTMVSPWASEGVSATTFAVSTAIWIVIVQWLSSGMGGYITGRLRTRWTGTQTDEVFFRDTAHGILAWALSTLIIAGTLTSAVTSTINSGVQAASTVTSGAALATASAAANVDSGPTAYFVDSLLRPADPGATTAETNAQDAAQASRILINGATAGEIPADDRAYLGRLVAVRTGLSEADANARVDTVLKSIEDAKVAAQEAADTARKAGATFALLTALSLLVGAFIAGVSAALGGRERDVIDESFIKG